MKSLGWVAIPKGGDRPIGTRGRMMIYSSKEKAIWSAAQGFMWMFPDSYEKAKEQVMNNFNFKEVYCDE
jgi:hypothetical protein